MTSRVPEPKPQSCFPGHILLPLRMREESGKTVHTDVGLALGVISWSLSGHSPPLHPPSPLSSPQSALWSALSPQSDFFPPGPVHLP